MRRPLSRLAKSTATVVVLIALASCSGDDETVPDAAPTSATPNVTRAMTDKPTCGVTLDEVQALLAPSSGVTENTAPHPGRCNFTWDDGGPRGIDVAIVAGGRASFEVPSGYEPLEGNGAEAFGSFSTGRASVIAFVSDDLYAADVVADGAGTTAAELRELCLQVLELMRD